MNQSFFELTPATIDSIENIFRDLLGDSFINEANSYNTFGVQDHEKIIVTADTHPFFELWQTYKQKVFQTKREGILRISEEIVELIDLLLNLKTIKSIKNNERITNAIKRKGTFHSACFEACIAAGYKMLGYTVDIMEESEQKTPDLVIKTGKGKVYVECKSLEDFSIKRTNALEELMSDIENYLFKNKKSYSILISLGYVVDYKNKDELATFIKHLISNNILGVRVNHELQTKIEIIKNREWDEIFYENMSLPNTHLCVGRCQSKILPSGINENMNLTSVAVEPFVDLNVEDRIIEEFKKARKQLPKNSCGMIHIQLPIKTGFDFLSIIDKTYDKLQKRFENNTKRACSVVLSHAIINLQEFATPLIRQSFIIPNNKSEKEMPKDFRILGTYIDFPLPKTNKDLTNFPEKEGKMEISFKLKSSWEDIPNGMILPNYSDSTGRHQLRLWKTWYNSLRFEIINPEIGRLYTEIQEPNFAMHETLKYFIEWNQNSILLKTDNNKSSKYERNIL